MPNDLEATAGNGPAPSSEESSIVKPSRPEPHHTHGDTETPTSDNASQKRFSARSLAAHFIETPDTVHADVVLIFCCYITGLVDSSTYNAWTVFSGMQTGNTIFLGLGASNQPMTHPYGWLKSLTSICSFLVGSFFFARLYRLLKPLFRRTLALSFALQAICLYICAALVLSPVVPSSPDDGSGEVDFIVLVPVFFLAFQSGGQMVSSRVLGINEVPSLVLTSVYCDLASDPQLTAPVKANVKRNRRIFAIIMVLLGGITGGWMSKKFQDISEVLWLCAAMKTAMVVFWMTWKGKDP